MCVTGSRSPPIRPQGMSQRTEMDPPAPDAMHRPPRWRTLRAERTPLGVSPELHKSWPRRNRRSPRLTSGMYLSMQYLTDSLVYARDKYVPNGAAILDVGCGEMPYYPIFAQSAGDYAGVDMFAGPNVRYVCPAEQLAIPDESFDVALSTQMLEHVRDPKAALSEMCRVLRTGGIALVSVPGVWPYHPVPNDYWRWTHQGLVALVEDVAGFDLIEIVPNGGTGACLASIAAYYTTVLTATKGTRIARLSAYMVALVNLLGVAGDKVLRRFSYPNEHALIVNYLVIARRQ